MFMGDIFHPRIKCLILITGVPWLYCAIGLFLERADQDIVMRCSKILNQVNN
jgi:hypothetical protein